LKCSLELLLADTCVKKISAAWLDELVLANYWYDNPRQFISCE